MTVQKSFKRLVREAHGQDGRELHRGEGAAARRGRGGEPADEEMPRLACSEEMIRERTGRGWEEWFDLLDSWGSETLGHTEIARRVGEMPGVLGVVRAGRSP